MSIPFHHMLSSTNGDNLCFYNPWQDVSLHNPHNDNNFIYVWHADSDCFENSMRDKDDYHDQYYYFIRSKPQVCLYIADDRRGFYNPCPNCVMKKFLPKIPDQKIQLYEIRFDDGGRQYTNFTTINKVIMVHFANGGGTFWVVRDPTGGYHKVRDLTRQEEIDLLPNDGEFTNVVADNFRAGLGLILMILSLGTVDTPFDLIKAANSKGYDGFYKDSNRNGKHQYDPRLNYWYNGSKWIELIDPNGVYLRPPAPKEKTETKK